MAEALDDGEFWLPSEFLTDDDILMEAKKFQKTESGARFCFPSEFPYGFSSSYGLNSPDESLVGSTETESDEDDYLAGFTRQMARSLLQQSENQNSVFCTENPKTRVMAGSPQSPLCGIGSWSGKSSSSSRGSPNGPSQVSSPPSTPLNVKDDAWDLLYAAAGQVKKMQLNDEAPKYSNIALLSVPLQKHTPVSNGGGGGCYSSESLTQQQLQANHFYQLKQQQLQQQQQQLQQTVWGRQLKAATAQHQQVVPNNGGRSAGLVNGRSTRPLGLPPSAWPPLQQQQQQQQNGMRAVFLGGHATRRESTGTGVFLPRRNGNPSESRRKTTCSTVLLPARVVQALNLNFEDMAVNGGAHHHQSRYYGAVHGNALLSQHQKRSFRPQPIINSEAQLPQEWTY
ncbi:hypothetical protein ACHQM5_020067 [Ranunculus cassubicifolius]